MLPRLVARVPLQQVVIQQELLVLVAVGEHAVAQTLMEEAAAVEDLPIALAVQRVVALLVLT